MKPKRRIESIPEALRIYHVILTTDNNLLKCSLIPRSAAVHNRHCRSHSAPFVHDTVGHVKITTAGLTDNIFSKPGNVETNYSEKSNMFTNSISSFI
jgi:hypothetical protein